MKTITFDYTKKDGSTSERTLAVMVEPKEAVDKYAGIDLSGISPEEGAEFVSLATQLYDAYLARLQTLQNDFDLKHSYRQFLASGMRNITEI